MAKKTTTFAAIDLGSYETGMKIYEFRRDGQIRELDHVRHRIDLGTETYRHRRISTAHIDELVRILQGYRQVMETYGVQDYRAYGTSAMRETDDIDIVLELLRQRTGMTVGILSNSEQRFLDYKSVALDTQAFARAIERPAAIVDIGGGSLQISLFDKDTLVSTQNFRMGVLRMRSTLDHIGAGIRRYDQLVTELVSSQLSIFTKMIVKDRRVENIVLLDDYVSPVISRLKTGGEQGVVNAKQFVAYIDDTLNHSSRETAKLLDISEDNVQLMYISGLLVKCIISHLGAETLWAPGVTLCDGIAYEYAEERGLLVEPHDFEQDIVACARNIAKRYQGSKSRSETLQAICLAIFDAMGETHGLGGRERLLLQIATILHDCGKYINLINLAECSYNIILSTEIIGLSHRERAIVANVVRYNHEEFDYYESTAFLSRGLDHDAYLIIAKLTAILRIANALDRTHKQKFRNVRIQVEEGRLVIQVDTNADITLEKGLFGNRAAFFEQIYGLKPVVIQKRLL